MQCGPLRVSSCSSHRRLSELAASIAASTLESALEIKLHVSRPGVVGLLALQKAFSLAWHAALIGGEATEARRPRSAIASIG